MMPLFKVDMPANAGIFFQNIMQIAAFDFYEIGDIVHKLFNIPSTNPLGINFETVGFES